MYATWIFDNWEGVEATTQGIKLNKFQLSAFNIPYGYSPVLLARKQSIQNNTRKFKKFIAALTKGYALTSENPTEAAKILKHYVTAQDKERIDLLSAVKKTAPYFATNNQFGTMSPTRVKTFLQWLVDNKLEDKKILQQKLFTNDLF